MKPLKPSMREKKRYLLVKGSNLKENIEKAILEFIGVFGLSECALYIVKISKGKAIISINRAMVDKVRASFCVFGEPISVEKVSGSIKNVKPLI